MKVQHQSPFETGVLDAVPLEYICPDGQFKGDVPLSLAVKVGKILFVSGIPGFDNAGKLAIGDFTAQMTQVMENMTRILKTAGSEWNRVVKVNVILTRREDFAEMNRIYTTYFPAGNFPARTTAIMFALPQPDFLLEIECQAVLE